MKLDAVLMIRAQYKCELCEGSEGLAVYEITPKRKTNENSTLIICTYCFEQLEALRENQELDTEHWRCLAESMMSEYAPIQVMSYRLLAALKNEEWAQELLGQMQIDDELANWAMMGLPLPPDPNDERPLTYDSEQTPIFDGDSVYLIKDLEVEGAGFTIKRGSLIKNILLTDDPRFIQANINDLQIVLSAEFMRKA